MSKLHIQCHTTINFNGIRIFHLVIGFSQSFPTIIESPPPMVDVHHQCTLYYCLNDHQHPCTIESRASPTPDVLYFRGQCSSFYTNVWEFDPLVYRRLCGPKW